MDGCREDAVIRGCAELWSRDQIGLITRCHSSFQVGVSLLLVGIVALNKVRMEIPLEKENQTKLVKFMIRMGVFSALYLVPLVVVIGCYLYEHTYRSIWETTWMQENCRRYHIPCPYKVEHWGGRVGVGVGVRLPGDPLVRLNDKGI